MSASEWDKLATAAKLVGETELELMWPSSGAGAYRAGIPASQAGYWCEQYHVGPKTLDGWKEVAVARNDLKLAATILYWEEGKQDDSYDKRIQDEVFDADYQG